MPEHLTKAGGTMTGDITLANDPDADMKAATKQYVDTAVSTFATAGGAYAEAIGDGVATEYTVTHGLNTRNIIAQTWAIPVTGTDYSLADAEVDSTGDNAIRVSFNSAPDTDSVLVVVSSGGAAADGSVEAVEVGNRMHINPFIDRDIVANRVGTWIVSATTGLQNDGSDLRSAEWFLDLPVGTYQMNVAYYSGTNRGIFVVELDDGAGSFTTLTTIDAYVVTAQSFTQDVTTGVVVGAAGKRRLRVRGTGKNASASAFYIGFQGASFERTA